MKWREFTAGSGARCQWGHAARGLLLAVNGVLVADDMAYRADADEGYDYDDVEHDA
jgi:hypothetical protein